MKKYLRIKVMKTIIFAKRLMGVIGLYFIIYNSIFGWNIEPKSEYETLCNMILDILLFISVILYFSPLVKVYEKFINDYLK